MIDWELNLKIFAGTDPPNKTDYAAHAKRAKCINDRQSLTVVKIFRGKNRTPALKWLLLGKRKEIFIIYIYLPRVGFSDYCTEFILCIDFKSNLYGLQFYNTSNHIITNAF